MRTSPARGDFVSRWALTEVLRAELALAAGQPEVAAQAWRSALVSDAHSGYLHARLGSTLLMLGADDEALRELQEAERCDSSLVAAQVDQAQVLMRQQQLDAADAVLRRALARDPRYAPGYLVLAALYEARGAPMHAAQVYRRLAAAMPGSPGAIAADLHRARLAEQRGEGRVARALLERALHSDLQHAAACGELVRLLISAGKLEQAMTWVLRCAPGQSAPWRRRPRRLVEVLP